MPYFIYILQSEKNGRYYIGSTSDIDDRLKRHNEGRSRYTKTGTPWKLVYKEELPNKTSALKRENYLKRQKSKKLIDSLTKNP
jgi:putative endonuclease